MPDTCAHLGPPARRLPLLHPERFGRVLVGNLVSATGSAVHLTVAAWIVFSMTRSSSWVGLLTMAQQLPVLALALPAGIAADHVDRRRFLVHIHAGTMGIALVLAALAVTGAATPSLLVVATVLMGAGSAFSGPAWMGFLDERASPDEAMRVYSCNSLTFHGAAAIGPAIAAALLGAVGAAGVFALNGLSYLAVIYGVRSSRATHRELSPFDGVRTATAEVLAFVSSSGAARRLLLAGGSMAVVVFGLPAVLPVFAADALGGGAARYGVLSGAIGLGSFAGAGLMFVLSYWLSKRHVIVLGACLIPLGVLTLAVAHGTGTAMVGLFLMGCGQLVMLVTSRTALMLEAPAHLRGRVASLWLAVVFGCGPLGGIVLGAASDAWGIHATVRGAAAYVVACAAAVALGAMPVCRARRAFQETSALA